MYDTADNFLLEGFLMAVFVIDCPHCGAKKSSFGAVASFPDPTSNRTVFSVLGVCSSCHRPVAFVVGSGTTHDPAQHPGNVLATPNFHLMNAYPAPPVIDIPESVPADVARAFEQAEKARHAGIWDAAAAMYRKAMELGLKDLSPGIEAWKIEKRIDKMHAQGLITADIKDWAHELRLDGNDSVHEISVEKETVEQMMSFCRALFMYLYSLPGQVKAARARRAAAA